MDDEQKLMMVAHRSIVYKAYMEYEKAKINLIDCESKMKVALRMFSDWAMSNKLSYEIVDGDDGFSINIL